MRLELGKPVNCTDGPFGKLADAAQRRLVQQRWLVFVGRSSRGEGDDVDPVHGAHCLHRETAVQGVAEDEGAGDEDDTQDDGERGGYQPPPRETQPSQCSAQHGSALQSSEPVEDELRGGVGDVVDHPAVPQEHHPVGVGGGDRVVGDHHDGLP